MNVYDFDRTIYSADSSLEFYKFCLKKKKSIFLVLPKQCAFFALYTVGIIKKERAKEVFFSFLKYLDKPDEVVEAFWNENISKIAAWYLSQHRSDDIVISASPRFLLEPVCKRLDIQYLIASEFSIRDGKLTGNNCYGEEKVHRFCNSFKNAQIDNFYTDSHSDFPMARLAKNAWLVKNGTVNQWNMEGFEDGAI